MFKINKKEKKLADLITNKSVKPKTPDINKTSKAIKKTFDRLGLKVNMGDVYIGPRVTQYTFTPKRKTRVADFDGVDKDIALSTGARSVKMEIPVPGTSFGGIEIPNLEVGTTALGDLFKNKNFDINSKDLIIPFGVDTLGKPEYVDFINLPHLLIGGAVSSGKTSFINSVIISLMCKFVPDELQFLLVDPRRVEMSIYNDTQYLLRPVITDVKKTLNALKWTVAEMERRFETLSNKSKINIVEYNKCAKEKLPYIFFVVDELADVMCVAAAEAEANIIKLSQMARAVGIHMVLATQRPSKDVLSGLMKANITSRLAFSTASKDDSEVILDMSGAEHLLGVGDALFISPELARPKRLQIPFVSDEEIERVVARTKTD